MLAVGGEIPVEKQIVLSSTSYAIIRLLLRLSGHERIMGKVLLMSGRQNKHLVSGFICNLRKEIFLCRRSRVHEAAVAMKGSS